MGAVATLLVVLTGRAGLLGGPERWLYDQRVRFFQFFQPPPTDKIAFLDIDDAALDDIGKWPWPRTELARITREVHRAGARTVAFDMIFSEPQSPRAERQRDGKPGPWIDDDEEFARSIGLVDPTLIPVAFATRRPDPVFTFLVDEFTKDPEQESVKAEHREADGAHPEARAKGADREFASLRAKLLASGLAGAKESAEDRDLFVSARRQAMATRVSLALDDPTIDFDGLRRRILPKTDLSADTGSPLLRLLQRLQPQLKALHALRRFAAPVDPNLPPLLATSDPLPPIPALAQASTGTGFVTYLADDDGVVRSLPLCAEIDGRLYPQLGLSLACALLGVPTASIQARADAITLPRPVDQGGDIVIPVHTRYSTALGQRVGLVMDLPWLGHKNDWVNIFNDHGQAHVSIVIAWDADRIQERIGSNDDSADEAMRAVLAVADESLLEELNAKPIPRENSAERTPLIEKTLAAAQFFIPSMEKMTPADIDAEADRLTASERRDLEGSLARLRPLTLKPEALAQALAEMSEADRANYLEMLAPKVPGGTDGLEKVLSRYRADQHHKLAVFMPSIRALQRIRQDNPRLEENLREIRGKLRELLEGKAVLVGWTATAAAADFVPTSLHAKCPGVVIHGVVANGILTHRLWRQAAPWVAVALTVLVGALMTIGIALLSPPASFIVAVLLTAAYVLFNGVVLFDRYHLIVGQAAPLTLIPLIWTAGSVVRYAILDSERRHIKSRFSAYNDPQLYNFVLEHPDDAAFEGQSREMTVVFTDLAGFTTLSEKLGVATVPLLNDYLGLMVPVIRDNRGYLNKFLGDGIMFFYGAPPFPNAAHPADALRTALQMQSLMPGFNAGLKARGLPPLAMRIGIATGDMVVGDAGAVRKGAAALASDYTVLGDTVNLGSRLEGANKATGTHILVTARTIELAGGDFLVRPIANLRVKGRTGGMMTYEPLALRAGAAPELVRLAELTTAMVEAYAAARFTECLAAVARLEEVAGKGKLTDLYRALCEGYEANPLTAGGGFDGQIVLMDK